MTDIWRHRLNLKDGSVHQFTAPNSARVISAQLRLGAGDSAFDVWFEVSNDAELEETIKINAVFVGTGTGEVPTTGNYRFINTFQLGNGIFVFHLYVDDGKTGASHD